jgi:hypothetical protein
MGASRGDVMATTNKEREMLVAVEQIVGFAKQFDEAHLNLACHAAFPLVLTPDLLYQIWAHFVPEAPWTAVARVLLSRLCRQVGYEMYEMDIAVRNLLLKELKEQFGQKRLEELGAFLIDYVAQQLTGDDPDTQDLREAQEWTALAYTKPDEAARKLAQALTQRVKQEDMAEILRLTSLVETFAEPLVEAGFEPLLVYVNGMATFIRGNQESAKYQWGKLPVQERQIQIAGVSLYIPIMISKIPPQPKQFEFILEQCSAEQAEILKKVRTKILGVDSRLREFPETRHIRYGTTSAICAAIKFEKKWNEPKLLLKLPIPKTRERGLSERRGMMSFGIESIELKDNPLLIYQQPHTNNKSFPFKRFIPSPEANKTKLEMLLDMALQKWLEKNPPTNS